MSFEHTFCSNRLILICLWCDIVHRSLQLCVKNAEYIMDISPVQSSRKNAVRNPPRSNLEVLGSLTTNVILLIPLLLFILAMALDSNPLTHEQRYHFTSSSCPADFKCHLDRDQLQVSAKQAASILGYLDFYVDVDYSNASSDLSLINAHVTAYALDTHHYITQVFSSANIQASSSGKSRLYISELRLDRPYLRSSSKFVVHNISLSGFDANLGRINTLLPYTTFTVNVQRTAFVISRALLQVSFSLAVIGVFYLWMRNLCVYHTKLSSSPKHICNISCQYMLAEQVQVICSYFIS